MTMSHEQIFLVGLLLIVGSLIQSTVGFGFGLFAIPLLVWIGIPLPHTLAIMIFSAAVQSAWGCYRHHEQVAWKSGAFLTAARLVSLPVGVWLLTWIVSLGQSRVRQIVGGVLLGVLLMRTCFRVSPRPHLHWAWGAAAGICSGILSGMTGMGSPPIVLWIMAHDWPVARARTLIWSITLLTAPATLALLVYQFGRPVLVAFLIGGAFSPLTLAGSNMGLWVGGRLSRQRLRWAMTAFLVLVALASIVGPLWRGA